MNSNSVHPSRDESWSRPGGRTPLFQRLVASAVVLAVLVPAVPVAAVVDTTATVVTDTTTTTTSAPLDTQTVDTTIAPATTDPAVVDTTVPAETTTTTPTELTPAPTETTTPAPSSTATTTTSTASIIVKVVANLDAMALSDVVSRNGGEATSYIKALQLLVVDVPAADVDAMIAKYRADASVVSVSLDRVRDVRASATDPAYGSQWALRQIGWDQVNGEVAVADGVKVAVLDTGVAEIADLSGRLGAGFSAFGTNPRNDQNGHGTEMASIVAAAVNDGEGIAGVAYGDVTVLPVQVLDVNGEGSDSDIIEGLVWAVDNGADVVLMAFSNPGYSPALQAAIDYAWWNGVVLVAAAGNDGSTTATYPAGSSKVIGVGGSTASDRVWSGSNQSASVYLTAPAVGISTIDASGALTSVTGTSASAAIVAGAAAVLRGAHTSASNAVVVGRLARNADPLTDATLGNGRVNLARAVGDTSTEGVTPMGVSGSGGPVVGPYMAAATRTITGYVKDTGGTAIGNATVSCITNCTGSVSSDPSTGFYSLTATWNGNGSANLTIGARKSNYLPQTINLASTAASGPTITNKDFSLTQDLDPPVVSSISRVGLSPTNGSSVSWTVTFSESVTGVETGTNTSDFSTTLTGTLAAGSPSVSVSGTTYTVTVGSLTGSGTIQLNVLDDDSISDLAENKLGGTGLSNGGVSGVNAVFTIDKSSPTVTAVSPTGTSPTSGSSVSWTVTFSETVTGVDASDFSRVLGTGMSAGTPSVTGSGSSYTVTVADISGSGTVQLNVLDDDSIVDSVGNKLGGTNSGGSGSGAVSGTGVRYTIDQTPPTASIAYLAGASTTTNSSSVSWTVTFSETVTGVDASDFSRVLGAGMSAGTPSVTGSGSSYTVTVSDISGSGTIQLNVLDDDSIVDSVGNKLGGTNSGGSGSGAVSGTGVRYTIDQTAPTVQGITRLDASPTKANSVRWTVTFTKSVSNVDASDFSVNTNGVVVGAQTVTGSGTSYTVTVPLTSGEGTVRLDVVDNDSIQDVFTNPLGGPGAGNGSLEGVDSVYAVDKMSPTVVSIARPADVGIYTAAQSVVWRVVFSEPVNGVDASDFDLYTRSSCTGSQTRVNRPSISSVTSATGSSPSTAWNVTVNTGTKNGELCLDQLKKNNNSITDALGNEIASSYLMSISPHFDQRYVIEKNAPFVASITRTETNAFTKENIVSWITTFSEAVGGDSAASGPTNGVSAEDFRLSGFVSGVLTSSAVGVGVTSVSPVVATAFVGADGVTRYTQFRVSGDISGYSEGEVQLQLIDNDTIFNASEIELRSSISTKDLTNIIGDFLVGEAYVIDRTAPSLTIDAIGVFKLDTMYRPNNVTGGRGQAAGDLGDVTVEYFVGKTIGSDSAVLTDTDGRSGQADWSSQVSKGNPGQGLNQGWYTARATQFDAAGNKTQVTRTFLIDDVQPVITLSAPAPQSLTNEPSQSWSLTIVDGVGPADASGLNKVECNLVGPTGTKIVPCSTPTQAVGATTASAGVSLSSSLFEGCNALSVKVFDNAGNVQTFTWNGVLDTVAPEVRLTSPTHETYTNIDTPTATGTGGTATPVGCGFAAPATSLGAPSADNGKVSVRLFEGQLSSSQIEASINGSSSVYEVPLNSGAFSLVIPPEAAVVSLASGLPEGWYSLRAEQSDTAGNRGTSSIVWFLVDTTEPTVTIKTMPDVETNKKTAQFEFTRNDPRGSNENADPSLFTVDDSLYALCRLDPVEGTTWSPCTKDNTFFTEENKASEGPHSLEVKVVDRAGNESDVETHNWLVDYTDPTLEITSAPKDPTVITGASSTSPFDFEFLSNDPDPDQEGAAVPSEVERIECKLNLTSYVDCDSLTSHSFASLPIGHHVFTVRSTDGAGNFNEQVHEWDIQANRSVLYTGAYLVSKPNSIALKATISAAADVVAKCANGIEVAFTLSLDSVVKFEGKATSNSSGVASLTIPSTSGWIEGVYDLQVSIPESDYCTGAEDFAAVTVASSGTAATGGGSYTVSGAGRVNFGLSINRVPNSNPVQFRGQVLAQNNGKWRLKGSINNYVRLSTSTGAKGSASGVGTLQWWDASIGDSGAWVVVASNVNFSVLFEDLGSKRGADSFTVNNIAYKSDSLTFGTKMFTSNTAQSLKGGDLRLL